MRERVAKHVAELPKSGIRKFFDIVAQSKDIVSLGVGEGATAKVKWEQGGEEKELPLTPSEATATKVSFAAVEALDDVPDDTELTVELTWPDGQSAAKNAALLAAE